MQSIAEMILDGLDRFYRAFQKKRVLKSLEEISATTNEEDIAAAVAVAELNNNLGNCRLEQKGNDFYIVGADAVRKKLGSENYKINATFAANVYGGSGLGSTSRFTYTITVQDGKVSCPDISRAIYNPVNEVSWAVSEEKRPTIRLESLAISKV